MVQLQCPHGLGNIVSLGRLEIMTKYYNDKFQLKLHFIRKKVEEVLFAQTIV